MATRRVLIWPHFQGSNSRIQGPRMADYLSSLGAKYEDLPGVIEVFDKDLSQGWLM